MLDEPLTAGDIGFRELADQGFGRFVPKHHPMRGTLKKREQIRGKALGLRDVHAVRRREFFKGNRRRQHSEPAQDQLNIQLAGAAGSCGVLRRRDALR
jgi:hypothetical protein